MGHTHREREREERRKKGRMVARMRSGRTTSARNAGKNVAMRTQRRRVGMRAASAETYSPPKVAPYEVEDKGAMPQKEYEALECPINTYKNKAPFKAKVKSVERIVGPNATGETCHIVIEHQGEVPYWEGQSYGVIPPGTKVNARGKEVPHGVRLYSIASTRYAIPLTERQPHSASAEQHTGAQSWELKTLQRKASAPISCAMRSQEMSSISQVHLVR